MNTSTKNHLMECLARELLRWTLADRKTFVSNWCKSKGARACDQLKRYLIAQSRTAEQKREAKR